MIELAQHIEALLLENDCVIIPDLGGFVAHYTPSERVKEENLFLPPTRVIGFNPLLKINDGLLVQSYMAAYDTNFPDAAKRVEREVKRLSAALYEEGRMELPNVGELRYSIHGTYDFVPFDNRLTTPALYGLDSFEMEELSALEKPVPKPAPVVPLVAKEKSGSKFKLSYAINAAAIAIVAFVIYFFSVPIDRQQTAKDNYAKLIPTELFEGNQQPSAQKRKQTQPVAVKEVKVAKAEAETKPAPAPLPYHIIVASVGTERDAEAMAKRLVEKGHPNARAIIGDGKMRVCIDSFATEAEAYRALNKVRETETEQAWVLKK